MIKRVCLKYNPRVGLRKYSTKPWSKSNTTPRSIIHNILFISTFFGVSYHITNNLTFNDAAVRHGHDYVNTDTFPFIQLSELSLHNTPNDCWVSVHGHVYDVTEFLGSHPGGAAKLLQYAGKDATRGFKLQHPETHLENFLAPDYYKGELLVPEKESKEKKNKMNKETTSKNDVVDSEKVSFKEGDDVKQYYKDLVKNKLGKQKKKKKKKEKVGVKTEPIYNDETKPSISQIFSVNDFEFVASKLLPKLLYTYIQSGSDNEFARFENKAALGRIFFRPKCLVDVRHLELNKEILGVNTKIPFLIGSFPGSGLIQDAGEKIVVKTAAENDMLYVIPKDNDSGLDELIKASNGKDVFYQFSIDNTNELKDLSITLNNLSNKFPNIKAIFIDINSTPGNLEHYKKVEASRNLYESEPAPQLPNKTESPDFKLCWDNLLKIKNDVKIPIILKGTQRPEDIVRSKELGFRGVLISNHEGKQLDQCQSPIEVLYNTRKFLNNNDNKDKFEIFVEGGFRRGSDIVKALCLGGTPVISKPILFSEVYSEAGVSKSIEILNKEINTTMKLIGARSVNELNGDFIDCESLKFKVTTVKNLDIMYDDNYTVMPRPKFQNEEKLKFV